MDYEIIVVNNGSTDNTREVLDQFKDKITVIDLDLNTGAGSVPSNIAAKGANGKYLAFLDDDDIWLPNKLEKQVAYLESNPNIALVYSDMFLFDENGVFPNTWVKEYSLLPREQLWSLFVRNCIPSSSVILIRRECWDEVGGFDETIGPCFDYDLYLRLIEKWNIHFLNEPLVYYRKYGNRQSNNEEKMTLSWLRVKEKAFKRNPGLRQLPLMVLDKSFYNAYLLVAYSYIQCHKCEQARQFLECYRELRGVNGVYEWLWMMSFPALKSHNQNFAAGQDNSQRVP